MAFLGLHRTVSIRRSTRQSSLLRLLRLLRSFMHSHAVLAQYAAVNGWILGNSNGMYQTTYNGTLNSTGSPITKQPTLFGTDLQCASVWASPATSCATTWHPDAVSYALRCLSCVLAAMHRHDRMSVSRREVSRLHPQVLACLLHDEVSAVATLTYVKL